MQIVGRNSNFDRVVFIHTKCDSCKKSVKEVGRLFKVRYLWLCKTCRKKRK